MRKNILVLLCVAFIIQFTGLLPLQAGHYYYKQISLKDGLPSTVRCILTDEQGFVWIGARSGHERDGTGNRTGMNSKNMFIRPMILIPFHIILSIR